jgi:hypothetical protein
MPLNDRPEDRSDRDVGPQFARYFQDQIEASLIAQMTGFSTVSLLNQESKLLWPPHLALMYALCTDMEPGSPRLVKHVDGSFLGQVTELYRQKIPPGELISITSGHAIQRIHTFDCTNRSRVAGALDLYITNPFGVDRGCRIGPMQQLGIPFAKRCQVGHRMRGDNALSSE